MKWWRGEASASIHKKDTVSDIMLWMPGRKPMHQERWWSCKSREVVQRREYVCDWYERELRQNQDPVLKLFQPADILNKASVYGAMREMSE